MSEKHDILTREDVQTMVKTFYQNLLKNAVIRPVFDGLDFEKHLPNMYAFWNFILLDEPGYQSNVFEKHLHLDIKKEHFNIWLSNFKETVDSLFLGPKADLAKQRAELIAYTFESKLNAMGRLE